MRSYRCCGLECSLWSDQIDPLEALALKAGGWVDFFVVMSLTARDESEKSVH